MSLYVFCFVDGASRFASLESALAIISIPHTAPQVSLAPIPKPKPSDMRKTSFSSIPMTSENVQATAWAQLYPLWCFFTASSALFPINYFISFLLNRCLFVSCFSLTVRAADTDKLYYTVEFSESQQRPDSRLSGCRRVSFDTGEDFCLTEKSEKTKSNVNFLRNKS